MPKFSTWFGHYDKFQCLYSFSVSLTLWNLHWPGSEFHLKNIYSSLSLSGSARNYWYAKRAPFPPVMYNVENLHCRFVWNAFYMGMHATCFLGCVVLGSYFPFLGFSFLSIKRGCWNFIYTEVSFISNILYLSRPFNAFLKNQQQFSILNVWARVQPGSTQYWAHKTLITLVKEELRGHPPLPTPTHTLWD